MKKYYFLKIAVYFSLLISTIYCSFGQTLPTYLPSNGLIAWYPFNGNANDESGHSLNGNVIGATLTYDRNNIFNAAYNFSYTNATYGNLNNEIYIAYSPILNVSNITISLWVYQRQYYWSSNPNPPISTLIARFQNGNSIPSGEVWMVNSGSNAIGAFANAGALTLYSWNHIVSTYDGNVGKIYINGTLINTQNNSSGLNINGSSGISIGESNQANGFWWPTDGIIDDIGIWNRALTQQEISQLYMGDCIPPSNATAITGLSTVCQNQISITYAIPVIPNATSYQWSLPSGAFGTSTTNTITVNYGTSAVSGNINVKGINSCGESNISSLFVNVTPLPISSLPLTIQACSTAIINANPGYTYLWSTGATTQSITVNQNGWYKCILSNGNCSVTDSTNVTINNQYNYNCELRNDEQTSPTTYEFDIYVLNTNDCVPLIYASGAYGITLNPAITNSGSISVSIVSASSQLNASQQPTSISYTASQNAIKILPKTAPNVGLSTIIPINSPGIKVCRVKITNSQPFAATTANLNWSLTSTPYQSKVNAYINNVNTLLTANTTSHTTHHLLNPTFIGLSPPTSVTTDSNNLCATDTGSIVLTATGGSGNTLKWYKDSCGGVSFASGINITIPSPDITTTYYARWEMSDIVSSCVGVVINISTALMVSSSITENTNHFCRGTSVTLTATHQNGGNTPLIQWYKNNQLLTGENNLFYTYSAFNNDSIYCVLTSSLNGCLSSQTAKSNPIAILVDNPPKYSHIKFYLEGFYNQSEQMMVAAMNDSTYQYGSNITDHITLMLANPYFPYTVTDTFNLALQTNGILIFDIPCWINGYHYLKIKSRNHLETWSMYAISFDNDSTYYDFSTSTDKAAGENQKQVSAGKYAILVGDVNQDGVVDISDLVDMDSDITNGTLGYIVYDLNGDGVIDISDLVTIDENITTGAVVYEPNVTLACANTTNISAITTSTATVDGNISCDGSALVTERGVCYSTLPNPTTANAIVISSNGLGSFSCNLTGLTAGTTYYIRAYATNSVGTAYGNEVIFSTITPIIIGQNYQGGIVAYILQPDDSGYVIGETHGLIAAPTDLGTVMWGCYGTEIAGADGITLGTGSQNTIEIVSGCLTTGIAARICSNLVLNGYSDWFLPSKDELNKLYINRLAIGGFTNSTYWSSSEFNAYIPWTFNFGIGIVGTSSKDYLNYVRAVRAF